MTRKTYDELRSARWMAPDDLRSFGHRSRVMQLGYGPEDWVGKPMIAIINTWSDIGTCHGHFKQRVEDVKRGILQSGGFPIELPAISLSESIVKPTTMLYRNLLAIETEELLRSHPIDGAVLMGGCDKTTPGLIMGALSAGYPFIYMPAGPMQSGNWKGQVLGSGSDTWKYWDERRAGKISAKQWIEVEGGIARSHGHCMTMGTASTMASMVEALGVGLPCNAAYPAVDGRRNVLARMAGRRAVAMVHEDQLLSKILTKEAFENAIKTLAAIGGSTNAVIHLIAIAGRLGLKLTVDDFDRLASELPCLVNLQPSGKYLMEDFCYAGGLPVVMKEISQHLHLDLVTANGQTVAANIADAENFNADVIKPLSAPFKEKAGIAVLRGNLSPRGAVIKPSAATPALMVHTGRAVVFETIEDFHARIDDETLDIDENCVMVLKNCGPKGYPGMAEVGNMPLPPKVLRKGITDMVRISDARMSGTAYGTVILHTAPEAAAGGPLALVHNGDMIELDVPKRRLHLHVSDEELARRRESWKAPEPPLTSGYWKLYIDRVLQADEGADLDFLVGKRGSFVPRDNH